MGIEEIRRLKSEGGKLKTKSPYVIPRVSEKRKKMMAEAKKEADPEQSMEAFFQARRLEMTGKCAHCGGASCKNDGEWFRASIAHILPKAYFKSIATHPKNWIELCFWKENCHGQMDNKLLDLTDMHCWDTIVERFLEMYPVIAKEERRRIPSTLMQYVNIDL